MTETIACSRLRDIGDWQKKRKLNCEENMIMKRKCEEMLALKLLSFPTIREPAQAT